MSIVLPARTAFPDLEPAGEVAPGLPVVDDHLEALVKEGHFSGAYLGNMHVSESFPAIGEDGDCSNSYPMARVLTYLIKPRMHMRNITWRIKSTLSAGAGANTVKVKVECLESGDISLVTDTQAVSPRYIDSTLLLDREDQLTTLEVSIESTTTGSVSIDSIEIWDTDLVQTDCHFDYYENATTAGSDDLVRYWPLQEMNGTNTSGVEKVSGTDPLTAYNGVTIDSEIVNVDRIFYRKFGSSDYMLGTWTYDKNTDFSLVLLIKDLNSTGQRTYIGFSEAGTLASGGGGIAFGAYNGRLLLEGNSLPTSSHYSSDVTLPNTEFNCYFLTYEAGTSLKLYRADGQGEVTLLITNLNIPVINGDGVRIGRGYGSAGYFDDIDYLNNGHVMCCGIWDDKVIDYRRMNAVARHLKYRGAQLVR